MVKKLLIGGAAAAAVSAETARGANAARQRPAWQRQTLQFSRVEEIRRPGIAHSLSRTARSLAPGDVSRSRSFSSRASSSPARPWVRRRCLYQIAQ